MGEAVLHIPSVPRQVAHDVVQGIQFVEVPVNIAAVEVDVSPGHVQCGMTEYGL